MKVVFLVRSLEVGGAERQLVMLARGLQAAGHDVSIAVFYAGGALEASLREDGISFVDLMKSGRWRFLGFFRKLLSYLWSVRPDVLYGCLPAANICVVLARPFLGNRPNVLLRLASAHVDLSRYDRMSRVSYWLEARLSRFSDFVIVNSRSGKRWAQERGFPSDRLQLIPNGIDLDYFRRNDAGGRLLREKWNIGPTALLVGLVGRLDPIKDHRTFLEAAHRFAERHPDARFICVGEGEEEYARTLRAAVQALDLSDKVIWAGTVRDMPAVYSAIDILTCCSLSEGFPNVVGEAMACETPCVATDVGDSRWIVDDTGEVVPVGDPRALVEAWSALARRLEHEGRLPGRRSRQRIAENFSHQKLIGDTESILRRFRGTSTVGDRKT